MNFGYSLKLSELDSPSPVDRIQHMWSEVSRLWSFSVKRRVNDHSLWTDGL